MSQSADEPRQGDDNSADIAGGIEATDVIDLVTLSRDESTIDLHIVQDIVWDGSDHVIESLQQKVHNYVSFAAEGRLAGKYTEQAHLPWRIVVDCQTDPDNRTAELLKHLEEPVAKHGGELVISKLG